MLLSPLLSPETGDEADQIAGNTRHVRHDLAAPLPVLARILRRLQFGDLELGEDHHDSGGECTPKCFLEMCLDKTIVLAQGYNVYNPVSTVAEHSRCSIDVVTQTIVSPKYPVVLRMRRLVGLTQLTRRL